MSERDKSVPLRPEFFGAAAFGCIALPVTTFAPIELPQRDRDRARIECATIVDYGLGNLTSVANALQRLDVATEVSHNREAILGAQALILPGVGAFGKAMENLRSAGLIDILAEAVLHRRRPTLGICLGMQLLAESSTEFGDHRGLGWLTGQVERLDGPRNLAIPHVGWNQVVKRASTVLFEGIPPGANFYFDHSFALRDCSDAVAHCDYDGAFVAAVEQENLMAVQFHPEKSQTAGLRLLRNFLSFAAQYTD
jgi:glutamine amidotransferase